MGSIPLISADAGGADQGRQGRQLKVFESTVRNPSPDIDPLIRLQAAQELMAMDVPEATAILADALQSGVPAVARAVIDAMESAPRPSKGLLLPAVARIQAASDENRQKLAMILPRYGRAALDLVAERALDEAASPARRIGPIMALAAFGSRDSASQLMKVIDEDRNPPSEIVDAACASLQQLTGLPYGTDPVKWREWWVRLKDEPIERWLQIVVEHLSGRNAELEREIQRQIDENREIARRLADTNRELFLSLDVDEQLRKIPELLTDPLAPMRAFAIGRVERMLRDSKQVSDDVQQLLAERVADIQEESALRLSAARVLSDLDYVEAANLIAGGLATERDPEAARGYLELLSKRSNPAALEPTLRWLDDAVAGAAAADALWGLLVKGTTKADAGILAASRGAFQIRRTPSHARLLAAVGTSVDRTTLEPMLDDEEGSLRVAVAEGLAYAGVQEPLLSRAGNDDLYPFAVRVLARGKANLTSLGVLANLVPKEINRGVWEEAVRSVTGRLVPTDLLEADELLAGLGHATPALRATVLQPVVEMPEATLPAGRRATLLERLANLQILVGDYSGAHHTSQRITDVPITETLAKLKFLTAVLSGAFEEAAVLSGAPQIWVTVFAGMIDDHPKEAAAMGDEIERRFDLDEQIRGKFDDARGRLPESRLTSGASDTDSPG